MLQTILIFTVILRCVTVSRGNAGLTFGTRDVIDIIGDQSLDQLIRGRVGSLVSSARSPQNVTFVRYQKQLINNITTILDTLLYGYDNKLRPNYGRKPTIISVDIMIRSMGSISELNMDFTMSMYFRQKWQDERLAYEGPVKILPVSIKILEQIWKPDTYFHNGKEAYVHSITVPNRFLRIDNRGNILYSTRLTVKARCPMNLRQFPMDKQDCPLIIGSFSYDNTDLLYKWGEENPVSLTSDLKFSQFAMRSINSYTISMDSSLKNSTMLKAEFHFKRHIGYFLLQIYLPCILIVVLSWVSFWINREATADRVGLSITSVLALSAFVLDARSDLPKSPYPTKLDKFVFVCLFYVSASLIEYAAVHYNTKFGTGELFLSEMLDVKLGFLRNHPGPAANPSWTKASHSDEQQQSSRNKSGRMFGIGPTLRRSVGPGAFNPTQIGLTARRNIRRSTKRVIESIRQGSQSKNFKEFKARYESNENSANNSIGVPETYPAGGGRSPPIQEQTESPLDDQQNTCGQVLKHERGSSYLEMNTLKKRNVVGEESAGRRSDSKTSSSVPSGQSPILELALLPAMSKKDASSKMTISDECSRQSVKPMRFQWRRPVTRPILINLLRNVCRLFMLWPFYLLSKLCKCCASQPKWSADGDIDQHRGSTGSTQGGAGVLEILGKAGTSPNKATGGSGGARRHGTGGSNYNKINSVSALDRISKILFPSTFILYNYFYWKPYFE